MMKGVNENEKYDLESKKIIKRFTSIGVNLRNKMEEKPVNTGMEEIL